MLNIQISMLHAQLIFKNCLMSELLTLLFVNRIPWDFVFIKAEFG